MTTKRDELAVRIAKHHDAFFGLEYAEPATQDYGLADELLAAGWTKPRTIETVDELAACEETTVVRSAFGNVYEKDADLDDERKTWWTAGGTDHEYPDNRVALPATVLWEPAP